MRTTHGLNIVDHCENCPYHDGDGFFCHLSSSALKELDSLKLISAYPAGASLFLEGQDPRGAFIVCQGAVKVYTTSTDARTIILRITGPGEVNRGIGHVTSRVVSIPRQAILIRHAEGWTRQRTFKASLRFKISHGSYVKFWPNPAV